MKFIGLSISLFLFLGKEFIGRQTKIRAYFVHKTRHSAYEALLIKMDNMRTEKSKRPNHEREQKLEEARHALQKMQGPAGCGSSGPETSPLSAVNNKGRQAIGFAEPQSSGSALLASKT